MKTHNLIALTALALAIFASCSSKDASSTTNNGTPADNPIITFQPYEAQVISEDKSNNMDVANGSQYTLNTVSVMMPVKIGSANIDAVVDSLQKMGNFSLKEGKCVIDSVAYGTTATNLPATTKALGQSSVDISISSLTPNLIVWQAYSYGYEAGSAHGISAYSYVNYYIPDNKVITLNDLILPAAKDKLVTALRDQAKSEVGLLTSVNELQLPDTFYIDDYRLQFVYQQGEIGPMSAGSINIPVVPSADMLTPLGKKIFNM